MSSGRDAARKNSGEAKAPNIAKRRAGGAPPASQIKRVVLCSGKVYYDLRNYRETQKVTGAALIRIGQLYPFWEEKMREVIGAFPPDAKLVWCREESQNMGA